MKRKWKNENKIKYRYISGHSAIKRNMYNEVFDTSLIELGFLNEYSLANYQEDFCEFSEYLFDGDERLWFAAEKYQNINNKILILIDFYNHIDTIYTYEYFRNIASINN